MNHQRASAVQLKFQSELWRDQIVRETASALEARYFMIRRSWTAVVITVLPACFGLIGTVLALNATLSSRLTDRVTNLTRAGGPVEKIEEFNSAFGSGSPAQKVASLEAAMRSNDDRLSRLGNNTALLSNLLSQAGDAIYRIGNSNPSRGKNVDLVRHFGWIESLQRQASGLSKQMQKDHPAVLEDQAALQEATKADQLPDPDK